MARRLAVLGMVVGAVIAPARGQPEAAPQGAEARALAGPRVRTSGEATTLVELGYAGKVRRLERAPEEAAIELLGLTPEERERVDGVLLARARVLDAIVLDNLTLLMRLGTAGEAGQKLTALGLGLELAGKLEPVWRDGPLRDRLRGALAPERRAEFDRLVDGYWDAIVAERRATKREPRFVILAGEQLALLGKEIERSVQRQFGEQDQGFERLIESLGLSAEQESRLRRQVETFFLQAGPRPTPGQMVGFLLRLMAWLDDGQRVKLAAYIAEEERRNREAIARLGASRAEPDRAPTEPEDANRPPP